MRLINISFHSVSFKFVSPQKETQVDRVQGFFFLKGIEGEIGIEFGPESFKIRWEKIGSLVNTKFSEIFNKNQLKTHTKFKNPRKLEAKNRSLQRKKNLGRI